ncbi:C-factor-like [Aphelenchoides bicaudatus]|nr:C-factor-like [Aphelenchoides bicaudatus]
MASYIGQNVFVTGASRGIGLGIVQHLLKYSDVKRIFAGARTPKEATDLQALAKQNPKIQIVQFDSLDDNSIKSAVKEVESKVGNDGLNLLINNAGVYLSDGNNALNPDREAVLTVYNTNVLQKADKPAKILNVSSVAGSTSGLVGSRVPLGNATYCSSKFVATSEYGKDLVVLAVHPGWVKTDMGGKQTAALTVDESVGGLLNTISKATLAESGKFVDQNGKDLPY